MGRTVVVGDVHGCSDELEALLAAAGFDPKSDQLVLVGDLVARGPYSHGVLALAKRVGAASVRGNHEHKILAARADPAQLGREHRRIAETFSEDEWRALEATPLWLDLPEHGVRVVHAGVIPGVALGDTPPRALLRIRTVDDDGRWSEEADGGTLWGERYVGPPHVVFGHNARTEPQLHAWATGIDTGCVYGGRLTAIVLEAGERMPRGEDARGRLVSVAARRKYYP